MKKLTIIFLILLTTNALATTITGQIYEWDTLETLNNVIIEIDSTPAQRMISTDGTYQFELTPGDYTITAKYIIKNQTIYEVKEKITIKDQGKYHYDLILTPNLDDELIELLEPEEELENIELTLQEEDESNLYPLLTILIVSIILIFTQLKQKTKKEPEEKLDKYAKEILQLLKKSGNRLTQREIRDKIDIGEAKISLIITELEKIGKIKKIKKGRGNIIVLKHV